MKQCKLLNLPRSRLYYKKRVRIKDDKALKEEIKVIYEKYPFYGYRKITEVLKQSGIKINHKKVERLMKELKIHALYPKANLSKPCRNGDKYPYLLKGIDIDMINKVWSGDITYIRTSKGYVYLFAIIDLYSRKIMSYRLSTSLDSSFCISAFEEAVYRYGKPDIFNTDQGKQFSNKDFINKLISLNIRISMDSKGRALDNIFIERFWRSLKYEEVYLKEYQSLMECRESIDSYFRFYNEIRPHQSLNYRTPDEVYESSERVCSELVFSSGYTQRQGMCKEYLHLNE